MEKGYQAETIISISIKTSFGKRLTSTVLLAGFDSPKYSAYTAFIAAKSFMFFRNTVVFATFKAVRPHDVSKPLQFAMTCRVCSTMSEPMMEAPSVDKGITPEKKYKFPTLTPWEYGPIGAGALSVSTNSFMFIIP